jgi:hypothetical protein
MSGWQRIGVVLSVLWLVGLPLYLGQQQNSLMLDGRINCNEGTTLPLGPQRDAAERHCEQLFPTVTFTDMFSGESATVLWAFTLVPVALLWVVGSIIIVTLRWIARGFRPQPLRLQEAVASSPSSTASRPPPHVELPAQQQAAKAPQQQQGAQQQKQDEYMGLLFWAVIIGVGIVLYNHPEWPISKHVAIFLHNLLKELGATGSN